MSHCPHTFHGLCDEYKKPVQVKTSGSELKALESSKEEWWLQRAHEFEKFVRDAHHVDIVIRKDGKDIHQEGDWIKALVRWFDILNTK